MHDHDLNWTNLKRVFVKDFWMALGPAWIAMMSDSDAASLLTAMQTAVADKFLFIPILLLLIIPMYFIQEVAGRVGSVTHKGLGRLARENFSKNWAIFLSFPMAASDFLTYVAEYAGIAIGMSILGVPPIVSLPIAYVAHLLIVYKQEYETAEKGLLIASAIMIVTFVAVMLSKGIPSYPLIPKPSDINSNFFFLLSATVGACVMPYMLFYQMSSTAQKRYKSVLASKVETLLGASVTQGIMVAVVMVFAAVGVGITLNGTGDITHAIMSIGGSWAPNLFAVGLVTAAFLALVVVSSASAWGVSEALDLDKKMWFKIYLLESVPAVIIPLLFPDLIGLVLNLMVAFVVILIGPVIAMGILAQNQKLMGMHALSTFDRVAYWGCVAAVLLAGLWVFIVPIISPGG